MYKKFTRYILPQDALEDYKQVHPGFEGTRELKLIMVTILFLLKYMWVILRPDL